MFNHLWLHYHFIKLKPKHGPVKAVYHQSFYFYTLIVGMDLENGLFLGQKTSVATVTSLFLNQDFEA